MKVFLVRHGQSLDRDLKRRQSPDSTLSKRGELEAKALGERIKRWGIDFDKVLSSKLPRAHGTAEIVGQKLGTKIEIFEGIREREQHPDIYSASEDSKIHKESLLEYRSNLRNLDFKFKGKGESIREVSKRASSFKRHLIKEHKKQNILVITHGVFIGCFIAVCILGDNFEDEPFSRLYSSIYIKNTGISLLTYSEEAKQWRIGYINNFSHLKNLPR